MIIQYCSDLHLEFKENREYIKANPIPVIGDVLILAGDVTLFALMEKHKDFFNYLSDHFAQTYWLPGNHEYYHFDISKKVGSLNEKIRENVSLVNNITLYPGGARLIFSTLWSKIRIANEWQVGQSMSDFQVIINNGNRFSVAAFNQLHVDSIEFLQAELNNKHSGKTIVVTHHVPTFQNYPAKYKGDPLNEAFAVELTPLIEQTCPDYWIYGHHHSNIGSFKVGTTELLTNQLGYVKYHENQSFRLDQHIIL